jgi:hypothetical protein
MMREFLLPSAREYDVVARSQQGGYVGRWDTPEFHKACLGKMTVIRQATEVTTEGDVFLWADTDIILFPPTVSQLLSMLGDADMLVALNRRGGKSSRRFCSGLMLFRVNEKTRRVAGLCCENPHDLAGGMDEPRFNHYAKEAAATIATIPRPLVWTVGFHPRYRRIRRQLQQGGRLQFAPPASMLAYHANYIKGVPAKMRALAHVKRQMRA